MKRERIDLRVRVDEKEKWEQAADKLGLTLSELLRRATTEYLALKLPSTMALRGE